MRNRIVMLAGSAALAAGVAACGGSTAPGVQLAPSAGLTSTTVTTAKVPPQLANRPPVPQVHGPAPSHLVVKDLITGNGAVVTAGATVTVNYVGALYNTGKVFDSSWSRGQPTTFSLSNLIRGWAQGMAGMRVGGRRELIIPPSLGYGKAGQPPTIPPNATLVFVVDVISVA